MRIYSVSLSLLVAVCLALAGNGLLATTVALRLADAGVGEAMAGFVLAGYFAGLCAGTLLLVPTIARVGHIRCFTAFSALGVAAALAHGLTEPGWVWGLLRAISGLCIAGVYMTVESWLNAEARPDRRGRVLAAYLVALYLGGGIGQLLIPWWQGPDSFVAAALLASLACVPIALTRAAEPAIARHRRLGPRTLLRRAPLGWWGAVVSGFVCATIYANAPLFARMQSLEDEDVAVLMAAFILGGLAGQWPIGLLSDRFDRRGVLLAALAALLALCAAFAVGAARNVPTLAVLAFAFGSLAFVLYPVAVAHTADRMGTGLALSAASQLLLASSIGAVLGPIVASAAMQSFGAAALFAVDGSAILALATAVSWRLVSTASVRRYRFRALPRTTALVNELDPGRPLPPARDTETTPIHGETA